MYFVIFFFRRIMLFLFFCSLDLLFGVLEISYFYKLFVVIEIMWDLCEEFEKLWILYVGFIVKDNLGVIVVNIFFMFCCLYKSICRKFYSLIWECCNYLVEDKFWDVIYYFLNCLEFLELWGDCFFVFIDIEILNWIKLLERYKFVVLELYLYFFSYM